MAGSGKLLHFTSATLEPQVQTRPGEEAGMPMPEIISALSFALDLTEGAVPGHAMRTCVLGMRIAERAGLGQGALSDLYYALLLKDIGCSSNAARMCQIVGGDDRAIKAGVKLEDWTQPQKPSLSTLKLLWANVLPEANFIERAARIVKIGATQHANNAEMIGPALRPRRKHHPQDRAQRGHSARRVLARRTLGRQRFIRNGCAVKASHCWRESPESPSTWTSLHRRHLQ